MRIISLSLVTLVAACGAEKSDSTLVGPEAPYADGMTDTGSDDASGAEEIDPCSAQGLRELATSSGRVLLDGVAMEASTPLADIIADLNGFDDQTIQIEGTIVDLCDGQGCWSLLTDGAGGQVRLKVDDQVLDFRTLTETGEYAVGEGVFEAEGEHGPQVWITGAVVVAIPAECE
jgi:hypothetical protein